MRVARALVVERRELTADLLLLWLSAPEISRGARPGQFVMLRPRDGLDPFLSRPFWIHRVRDGESGEEWGVLVRHTGRGGSLLFDVVIGQRLFVTGPLGRPLTLRPAVRSVLLVADATGIAPLVWCADEEAARGRSITLLAGATGEQELYPPALIHHEVEVAVATADGSAGHHGSVTDLLPEYAGWADQIIASGGVALYEEMAGVLRRLLWRRSCQVLMQPPMPCGTGICAGCGVETRRHGVKLACAAGPAFELREVF